MAEVIMGGYRADHFGLQELVHPSIYKARGERAWELLNPYAVITADQIRKRYGAQIINTWGWGDNTYTLSGLRPWRTKIGAKWSQHKYGGANDMKPQKVHVREMYDDILLHPELFPYLRVLEDVNYTPTWMHYDCRNHMKAGIWVINP